MRYLTVKGLPVVATLLLWAAATAAGADWYLLRPPHERDYFSFDESAPLTLWFREMQESGHAANFTFYTELLRDPGPVALGTAGVAMSHMIGLGMMGLAAGLYALIWVAAIWRRLGQT